MTAVYPNTTMDLSGGNGSDSEDEHAELNKALKVVFLVIYSLVFVLGALGNGVVIWVTGFLMKKTINTVWYLNLAVADFLFTISLPLAITKSAMDEHWPFGKFLCKLNFTVLYLNMFASVYILMVISVDRCVCVVWPVWAKNHRSVRKALCVSLGVWVLALALSSPYFIFNDTRPDKGIIVCDYNFADDSTPAKIQLLKFRLQAMIITRFLMAFVVPFTVIVSCYSVIIYRLRKSQSLAGHSGRSSKIIAALIVTFFLCWAPLHVMVQIQLAGIVAGEPNGARDHVITIGFPIVFCLAYINSCVNPLLYVFMGQDFKHEVRKSLLKVLENAFAEEVPQPSSTRANSGITSQETASLNLC